MLRYKVEKLKIVYPETSKKTILTIPEGKEVDLVAIGSTWESGVIVFLEVEGNRLVEYVSDTFMTQGNYNPLEGKLTGPTSVQVGGERLESGESEIYVTLVWRE